MTQPFVEGGKLCGKPVSIAFQIISLFTWVSGVGGQVVNASDDLSSNPFGIKIIFLLYYVKRRK